MSKYRILILNKIPQQGLARLPAAQYEVGNDVAGADAILVRSAPLHDMVIPASVQAIGRAGVGTNNIPVAEMNRRGIPVFNTPGANANAVKELVLTGMLLAARNIRPAIRFVEGLRGDDAQLSELAEGNKQHFSGIELRGRTLGIVGLGAIGGMVADAASKLGMKVLGYDPKITADEARQLAAEVQCTSSVEDVFRYADFVTLHVPLTDATRNLVNAERIATMKQGAVLLNFARDAVVDEQAVIDGLDANKLRAYVCDFPTARMMAHPGVLALPHLGASTEEAEVNCAVMVVDQLRQFLENGNIINSVNFPNVQMPRESAWRLAIANANVPNMVGQISTAMARAGLNIHNMANKSRGELAYTLLDLDSAVPASVVAQIRAIDGVLNVRELSFDQ